MFNSPQRPEMGREHFAVPLAFDPVFAAISHWLGGRGQRHAMTAEDVHGGPPAAASIFGGLAEVRGPHDRRRYDGELFHILVAKIVEAVHRASGDAQRLPGTNRDGRAVNRPGKDAVDAIEDFLAGVVLMGRHCQLLPDRDETVYATDECGNGQREPRPASSFRIPLGDRTGFFPVPHRQS